MNQEHLTVVVHGATGTQGAPVARRLAAAGHRVRGLARRPDALPPGVEPAAADLLDPAALAAAYRGADAVVVHLPLEFAPERAVPQAEAVLEALRHAGVGRVVVNTGGPTPPEPVGVPYLDARATLSAGVHALGVPATVLAPAGGYLENLSAPWSAPLVAAGDLAYPLPEPVPVPWVTLEDLAAVVGDLLADDAPPPVRLVAGPEALTGDALAAEVGAGIGREGRFRTIGPAEYEAMLRPHLGAQTAAGIAGFYASALEGPPPPPPDPALVVRGATRVRDWAAAQRWEGRAAA